MFLGDPLLHFLQKKLEEKSELMTIHVKKGVMTDNFPVRVV